MRERSAILQEDLGDFMKGLAQKSIDVSLNDLKERLAKMAGLVEQAVAIASDIAIKRDYEKIPEIYELEKKVNEHHTQLDDAAIKVLALQQPLAHDLRLIVAVLKINNDLERMGDQTVNIGHSLEHLLKHEDFRASRDLTIMFNEAKLMIRESLDAFITQSEELASEVLKRDDIVDGLKSKIFLENLSAMKLDGSTVDAGISIILIARNLERLGDHATNIAEDVIYAVSGKDVRHSFKSESIKGALR